MRLGPNMSDHKRAWAQTCLGTVMCSQSCGHNHVWVQTWWKPVAHREFQYLKLALPHACARSLLVETHLFKRLTGEFYEVFPREVLPGVLDNVSLGIRRHVWLLQPVVRRYLDRTHPNRWTGRSMVFKNRFSVGFSC